MGNEIFDFLEPRDDTIKRVLIQEYRKVFFNELDREGTGMKVLADLLFVVLAFDANAAPEDLPATIKRNCANKILENLGILHPANRLDIIQALAAVPVKSAVYTGVKTPSPLSGGHDK